MGGAGHRAGKVRRFGWKGDAAADVAGVSGHGSGSSSQDQLDYIAAMVRELSDLSARAGCRTLTGLLDLAYAEAMQRRR